MSNRRSPSPPLPSEPGAHHDRPEPESASADRATSRAELIGQILWECHRFSAVVERAIALSGKEQFASNNDVVTLAHLYVKGRSRPRELVPLLDLTRGGVTNLLDRLEALGAIERLRTSDDDLRGVDIVLTPAGRATVERITSAYAFAVDVSQPLFLQLGSLMIEAGLDCGGSPPNTQSSPRKLMSQVLALTAVVPDIWAGYGVGFGSDEPRPGRVFEILWMAARPGGTTPSDVVDATGLRPSGTTELIDRLESRGWVRRARSGADRRVTIVTILPSGRERLDVAIAQAEPHAHRFVAQLFRPRPGRID